MQYNRHVRNIALQLCYYTEEACRYFPFEENETHTIQMVLISTNSCILCHTPLLVDHKYNKTWFDFILTLR